MSTKATDFELVEIHCAVPYCGRLIGKAKPGSLVEIKCDRCYAITLWNNGKASITRSPRRVRNKDGRWITIEDPAEIDRIMRERVAVEGINVQRPRR